MAGNHLIVGLGGTGGRIIREIRKSLASIPEDRKSASHIEYLYVDSDAAMMKPDHPEWRVLGRNVALDRRQVLQLGGVSTRSILEDVDAYPNLKSWLGDMTQLRRYLEANVNPAAGAQRRRYGRLLFANSAQEFVRACTTLKQKLHGDSHSQQITVHICCGLAGGTGSGAIIDAVAQIRKHVAPNALPRGNTQTTDIKDDRVLLYLVLPEELPPGGWDSGFYHANGYAALVELNGLVTGAYRAADVSDDGAPMTLPQPAFNGAYLIQNKNMAGRIIDSEHALPQIIADFIMQKTLASQSVEVLRAENAENGDFADEPSVDGVNLHERSKRFLTFGIQRLVVPCEEIHEFFTYHYAHRVGRQFLFNHWANGIGYIDTKQNIDFTAVVADVAKLGGWLLSDEHLTLSRPILPTDGINAAGKLVWQPLAQFWPAVANQAAVDIKGSGTPKEGWLTALQNTLGQIFGQGFRSAGVGNFFLQKTQGVTQMAAQIRGSVERELFDAWRNGQYGIADIQSLLECLVRHVDGKLKNAPGIVAQLTERADGSRKGLVAVVNELSNVGMLGWATGKGERLFDAGKEHLIAELMQRTLAEGWTFAQRLLPLVIRELNGLLTDVGELRARLQRVVSEFESQYNARLQAPRTSRSGATDVANYQYKTKLFDAAPIYGIRDTLLADQARQSADAQAFRDSLFAELGRDAGFSQFLSQFHEGALTEKLVSLADGASERAAEQLPPPQHAVLTANIVEKLAQQYGGQDDGLVNLVREKVDAAAPYGTFDKSETSKKDAGTSNPAQVVKETCVVAIPSAPNASSFRDKLEKVFLGQLPSTVEKVHVQEEGVPTNEVTVYQIHNLFPLRWLAHTAFLRERYEHTVKGNATAAYFTHGEGALQDYPPLFIPSSGDLTQQTLPHLLVAFSLGMLKKSRNENTGKEEVVYAYSDADGFDHQLVVGQSEKDAITRMPSETALTIQRKVEAGIASDECRTADSRTQIYKGMVTFVNEYKDAHLHGNPNDEEYKRLMHAALDAKTRLLKLA